MAVRARGREDLAANAMIGARRILVPLDGTGAAVAALRLAAEVAHLNKGRVTAIYVIEVARHLPLEADVPAETERSEAIFAEAQEAVRQRAELVDFELLQARNAGATLVDEAVNSAAEVIVVGVGDKRQHGEFSLGSTAEFLLRHAPCQVWLCRGPLATATGQI
jgi:nucleotide-binding universal stress UspA family protein